MTEADRLIKECEDLFRMYEKSHREKGTPEGEAKAERNRIMADKCATFRVKRMERDDLIRVLDERHGIKVVGVN